MNFLTHYWYLLIGVPLLMAYLIYNSRHQGVEASQATDEVNVGAQWSIWNLVGFGLIVAAFLYSSALGYRTIGFAALVWGGQAIAIRRVLYGIEGRAPSGYLGGAASVIVGILIAAVGVFFILAPHVVEEILRDSGGS